VPSNLLGPNVVCVPVIPEKEAACLANGHPHQHEGNLSSKAIKATCPACDAVTAEILNMLPIPCQMVCFFSFIFHHLSFLFPIFSLK